MSSDRPSPLRLVVPEESSRAPQRSDDALCRAFLAGESAAFGELFVAHQTLVFSLVRRYAASSEDAHDLTQRAFLRALEAAKRALPRLGQSGPVPFKAWLVRIAINLGKNHIRGRRLWRLVPVEDVPEAAEPSNAVQRLERRQIDHAIRQAVLTLPRRQREVFTLRVDGELPFAEIAQALSTTENNCKVHFHLAVKRLKALFAQKYGGRDEL
jgi:RNA polymerase sigma-70 factor (ECF subfamily)